MEQKIHNSTHKCKLYSSNVIRSPHVRLCAVVDSTETKSLTDHTQLTHHFVCETPVVETGNLSS